MKLAIGCDHGGYALKEELKKYLTEKGNEVTDFGTYSTDSVDYPDFAYKVALGVSNKEFDKGIVVCSTGIGVSITANKVRNIRCALVHDIQTASLTRQHNDSNVIAFGAKIISSDLAKEILDIWLNTEFEGGRHIRRVNKMSEIEGSGIVNVLKHPLIDHKMTKLRDKNTSTKEFGEVVTEISKLMAYEVTRDLPLNEISIETPLKKCVGYELNKEVVIVPVLRAGLGMLNGIKELIPTAKVGMIGLYRNEETLKPEQYYCKLPNVKNPTVIICDPMLATGGSAAKAIELVKAKYTNSNIIYIGIVGTDKGINKILESNNDVKIYLASKDPELNENGYIVPGLGDCGDRLFGTK